MWGWGYGRGDAGHGSHHEGHALGGGDDRVVLGGPLVRLLLQPPGGILVCAATRSADVMCSKPAGKKKPNRSREHTQRGNVSGQANQK